MIKSLDPRQLTTRGLLMVMVVLMLACFMPENVVELVDYEVDVTKQDGGNTDQGYYWVLPRPVMPIVLGSAYVYGLSDWEVTGPNPKTSVDVQMDLALGYCTTINPTKLGKYTVSLTGQAFQSNDRWMPVTDTFDVEVVEPKRVVIDGFCASKVLVKGTSQQVSIRFDFDDPGGRLAYGKRYYPLGFDASLVDIPAFDRANDVHTIRTMYINVDKNVDDTVTLFDQLDGDRPVVFTTTDVRAIKDGKLLVLPEYISRSNNPGIQSVLLQVELGDGSLVCPGDYTLFSHTEEVCTVDKNRYGKQWIVRSFKQGTCKVEATADGFKGTVIQEFIIDPDPITTTEIRQREKGTE